MNVIEPKLASIRRRMSRPVVVLPHPLSPTSPKVSPGWMANETPSTARICRLGESTPLFSGNHLVRPFTSSSGMDEGVSNAINFYPENFYEMFERSSTGPGGSVRRR